MAAAFSQISTTADVPASTPLTSIVAANRFPSSARVELRRAAVAPGDVLSGSPSSTKAHRTPLVRSTALVPLTPEKARSAVRSLVVGASGSASTRTW